MSIYHNRFGKNIVAISKHKTDHYFATFQFPRKSIIFKNQLFFKFGTEKHKTKTLYILFAQF